MGNLGGRLRAAWLTGGYGVLSIAFGVLGYVRKDSKPSLIAGGIAGALLLLCAFGIFRRPFLALVGAIVVSVGLVGFFGQSLIKNAGNLAEHLDGVAGLRDVVLIPLGLLVIGVCARQLLRQP